MEQSHFKTDVSKIDVLILCGGLGSRLAPLIFDRPKCLATVLGRPFLDIIVDDLIKSGFKRIIFCVGHLSDQIMNHFTQRDEVEFMFSNEFQQLGTGGAIKNALNLVAGPLMLVLNGDSFCRIDYQKLLYFHNKKDSDATLVLSTISNRKDVGYVSLDEDCKIKNFIEKSHKRDRKLNYINAGVYLFNIDKLSFNKFSYPFSLELDVFPNLISSINFYGFTVNSKLIDIGTPERYLDINKHGIV